MQVLESCSGVDATMLDRASDPLTDYQRTRGMTLDRNRLLRLTTDVACAYVGHNRIPKSELPGLIANIYATIERQISPPPAASETRRAKRGRKPKLAFRQGRKPKK